MGPDAYRTAGISEAITALGHSVEDVGNLAPAAVDVATAPNSLVYKLAENVGWTHTLMSAARDHAQRGMPIFLGGDQKHKAFKFHPQFS